MSIFFRHFWSKFQVRREKVRSSSFPPQVEALEPRWLLAADIGFDAGTGIIIIKGTRLADSALVQKVDGNIVVGLQNKNVSLEKSFSPSGVNGVVFTGRGGDDRFENKTNVNTTAFGNRGNDELIGGSGNDLLRGGSGSDILRGGPGDDVLLGESGADNLRGGTGDDLMIGGDAADVLRGNDGDDLLNGNGGNDDVRGGAGHDDLRGGSGNDLLRGGSGSDILRGGPGDDVLLGESGADNLRGGTGDDLMIGGDAADVLRGNAHSDILIGGTTDFDGNFARLAAIIAAWTSAPDYGSAVDGLEDRDFEFFLRSSETVHDDLAVDRLMGSTGLDWFFDPGSGVYLHDHGTHVPDNLRGVQDDEVVNVTLPHAGDPVRQAEHFMAMALVSYDAVTHTAVKSGSWSDTETWENGQIPEADGNVLIGKGVTVAVDGVFAEALRTVRVDGILQFATAVATELRVETMLVAHDGMLTIGTSADPVADGVTAILSITGSPIDRILDPTAMGHGLISHGTVEFFGQEKTSHVPLAEAAKKGDTQLLLAETPINWEIGDTIVLAGTSKNGQQDELLEILAIDSTDGYRVTINPVTYTHKWPMDGLSAHVANLTRNVQVRSENPDDIGQRGHVMFMHSPHVDVNYAGFYGLGRSDKMTPLDDSVLNDDGSLQEGTGTNQRGRYAVHFHRHGVQNTGEPALVHGSVVFGSPGWGYVNHASFAEITDSAAYDAVGAAFVTEAGDEIGTFSGNIAIRGTGSGDAINSRKDVQDFGHQGDGFWFQGGGVAVFDNVAAGQKGNGFVFFTRGLVQDSIGTTIFLAENLSDPAIANGKATISVANVPLLSFHDNVAYGSTIGAATRFHLLNAKHDQQSVIENLVLWNNKTGLNIPYTNQTVVRNVTTVGNLKNPTGTGVNRNNITRNITYENLRVEGYDIGLYVPRRGRSVIDGGYFNNVRNIYITTAVRENRSVLITGDVLFGSLSESALRGRTQYRVVMQANISPFQDSIDHVFYSDTITLDFGEFIMRRLYYDAQTADTIPFPEPGEFIPSEYVGKTVQELFDEFGLAVGGEIATENATTADGIKGLVW